MDDENMHRASTRSRIPQVGLRELNSATTNARSGMSGILPPGTIAKKAISPTRTKSTSTVDTKRQPPTTRSAMGAPKTHTRGNSYTSSTITRSGSTASRPNNSNFSSTMSYGARPASAMARPQTSLGTRRLHSASTSMARPATSLEHHTEDHAASILGKRKGMPKSIYHTLHHSSWSITIPEESPHDHHVKVSRGLSHGAVNPESSTPPGPRKEVSPKLSSHTPPSLQRKKRDANDRFFHSVRSLPQSKVPIPSPARPTATDFRSSSKKSRRPPIPMFLSKDSTVTDFNYSLDTEWDLESKEKTMEEMIARVFTRVNQSGQESQGLKEAVEVYKVRITELEQSRDSINEKNMKLRVEMDSLAQQLHAAESALRDAQRDQEIALDDLEQRHRIELETMRQDNKKEMDSLTDRHEQDIRSLKRKFETEVAEEKAARVRELGQLTTQSAMDIQRTEIELEKKSREIRAAQAQIQAMRTDMDREMKTTHDLRHNLDTVNTNSVALESTIRALKARIEFLEGGREEQSQAFEHCNQRMMDALAETEATKEKLRREETLRRKLHNQVQELKGNIRVFCRVRPPLNSEPSSSIAPMQYPDETEDAKEINVMGPEERSSLGTVSRKNNTFTFDRVFGPSSQNTEVFDEISQLVQSALDGYNVCIFCYGQTGSGKTYTMSSQDGMIPLAVHQIYETAQSLEDKGWRYTMEGNFVEVYNENLNDLLGNPNELDRKKHEIRHDMQRGKTYITDITTVKLESPEMVETILKNAAANRSVAATKANERSSRSHSVFILKLNGENHITGERSEGTLNLVDLAGSERLSHSGVTGDRLKETQNINRSLSSLGDVIAALGQGKDGGHIPYRNSKLTYLLQFSLGGNSKTLMFVMVSPLQAHLSETLTSLKFATKVHNTHIGTAKRQARVRDS
ncbi:Kinesin-like protein [Penicillium ucsense]|uniref:Kinesin-like protein n=1 Tax=Penicillium ucsense TaxID=2839758 RepID=A0A8J8WLH1_9EURO|nr:Kinesin-like protein [Penicillium ucsense]KAF7733770.1 Kinesin-like protein [Penicillium ucsense]